MNNMDNSNNLVRKYLVDWHPDLTQKEKEEIIKEYFSSGCKAISLDG